ncbi:hypothetical protein EMIT051CA3_90102 [Pseudomonas chlororaphis]
MTDKTSEKVINSLFINKLENSFFVRSDTSPHQCPALCPTLSPPSDFRSIRFNFLDIS